MCAVPWASLGGIDQHFKAGAKKSYFGGVHVETKNGPGKLHLTVAPAFAIGRAWSNQSSRTAHCSRQTETRHKNGVTKS